VHQLHSKEDEGINAAALDSYFKDNGIRQQVKIIYGDNAGENDIDSLYLFLTSLGIRRLSSIAELRPAVEPSYGLFVGRSANPIDNPARPTPVAPYRARNTSSEPK